MEPPLKPIALLIPAYNRQEHLERTLKSLEPELHLLDIILVDDGSTPPLSIKQYAHYPIHLIRLPQNKGIVAALNRGLEYIYSKNYEFIGRLDSDDVAINQRFAKQLAFLKTHPEIGLLGSHFYWVNDKEDVLSSSVLPLEDKNIRKAMYLGLMLLHPTIMMRKDIAQKNGFYDANYKSEDYNFFWRMLEITKVANLPDFLVKYETGTKGAITSSKSNVRALALSGLIIKLEHFNALNIYSYLGICISLVQVSGALKYTRWLRKIIMDTFFSD